MMNDRRSWFEENPKKSFLIFFFLLILCAVFVSEISLRLFFGNRLTYYAGKKNARNSVIEYPYGRIYINSDGYPDKEFLPAKSKPRIAYVGDSVCYGVGAGYGFRISELLAKDFPGYEHMNMSGGLGNGIEYEVIPGILEAARKFGLDDIIYLMNLNDIIPDDAGQRSQARVIQRFSGLDEHMRGISYLYTFIRWKIAEFLIVTGFRAHGLQAYEMFPERNEGVIVQTCARIKELNERLKKSGVRLVVVILPYEMQISREAEEKYRSYKVHWGESFIARGPQKLIVDQFKKAGIAYVDAYFAFVREGDEAGSRERNKLGEFFVYNRGDKLDWNHPNREGHRKIAEYLAPYLRRVLAEGRQGSS